jgi:SET domain-containing protein 6
VASYSFVLGDDHYQGMVPVWDLLNHITGAMNVKLHHDAERGVLQVCALSFSVLSYLLYDCYFCYACE